MSTLWAVRIGDELIEDWARQRGLKIKRERRTIETHGTWVLVDATPEDEVRFGSDLRRARWTTTQQNDFETNRTSAHWPESGRFCGLLSASPQGIE